MRSVTWVQCKSHHFVNTADAFRERSHTHKSMQHVRPTGIFKPELWILCYCTASTPRADSAELGMSLGAPKRVRLAAQKTTNTVATTTP